jgi:predicted ATPase
VEEGSGFPFELPPVRGFRKMELTSSVTFFVGDNGSGKSTMLEAIGLRAKLSCIAGRPLEHDPSLVPIHPLARSLHLRWSPPTKYGFFLRVEDFFVYVREQRKRSESLATVKISPTRDTLVLTTESAEPERRPIDEFAGLSPGESFLQFLKEHCEPGGLHVIDEPEAVLSPQRQLDFMRLIKSIVAEKAQFIIATHSPILLAYPEAQLLSFDEGTITPVTYDQLTHVNFTRNFLSDPERYLRTL